MSLWSFPWSLSSASASFRAAHALNLLQAMRKTTRRFPAFLRRDSLPPQCSGAPRREGLRYALETPPSLPGENINPPKSLVSFVAGDKVSSNARPPRPFCPRFSDPVRSQSVPGCPKSESVLHIYDTPPREPPPSALRRNWEPETANVLFKPRRRGPLPPVDFSKKVQQIFPLRQASSPGCREASLRVRETNEPPRPGPPSPFPPK